MLRCKSLRLQILLWSNNAVSQLADYTVKAVELLMIVNNCKQCFMNKKVGLSKYSILLKF